MAKVAVKLGQNEPETYKKRIYRHLDIVDIVQGDSLGKEGDKVFLPVIVDTSQLNEVQFSRLKKMLTLGDNNNKRVHKLKRSVYGRLTFNEFLKVVVNKVTGRNLGAEWL